MIKPVLFNTEMVKAILDGRKEVTRRIIKPQPKNILCYSFAGSKGIAGTWGYPNSDAWKYWGCEYRPTTELTPEDWKKRWAPPYHTDDILYVRETWSPMYPNETSEEIVGYLYKADRDLYGDEYKKVYDKQYPDGKDWTWDGIWKPSIHMPKKAARLWLKVTNVRVQRIQEMTLQDSLKEGVKLSLRGMVETNGSELDAVKNETSLEIHGITDEGKRGALAPFAELWNSTVPKKELSVYGWDANPWVWVISFERIREEEVLDV